MKMNFLDSEQLRPEIMRRIEAMDEGSLLLLHHILLEVEKERNWRELSPQPDLDPRSGRNNRLPEVIHLSDFDLRAE
jgi:hypothetical protein